MHKALLLRLLLLFIPIDIRGSGRSRSALVPAGAFEDQSLVLTSLLLDLDLHQRILMVILVEIGGAEGHLGLSEDGLLVIGGARPDLMVLNEQVPMLVLSMPVVHFLLQAFNWLWLLLLVGGVGPLRDGHEVARVGHAVVAGLPGAHALGSLGDLVEVVLGHTAADIHRGHRMVLFIDERGHTASKMLLI